MPSQGVGTGVRLSWGALAAMPTGRQRTGAGRLCGRAWWIGPEVADREGFPLGERKPALASPGGCTGSSEGVGVFSARVQLPRCRRVVNSPVRAPSGRVRWIGPEENDADRSARGSRRLRAGLRGLPPGECVPARVVLGKTRGPPRKPLTPALLCCGRSRLDPGELSIHRCGRPISLPADQARENQRPAPLKEKRTAPDPRPSRGSDLRPAHTPQGDRPGLPVDPRVALHRPCAPPNSIQLGPARPTSNAA